MLPPMMRFLRRLLYRYRSDLGDHTETMCSSKVTRFIGDDFIDVKGDLVPYARLVSRANRPRHVLRLCRSVLAIAIRSEFGLSSWDRDYARSIVTGVRSRMTRRIFRKIVDIFRARSSNRKHRRYTSRRKLVGHGRGEISNSKTSVPIICNHKRPKADS